MFGDGETAAGNVSSVTRIGQTVRRPVGPWTPTVHALLQHLSRRGFRGAPEVLGTDEAGREVLSLLVGETAFRPWPQVLRTEDGIGQLGSWIASYHHAVADFNPPPDAQWRDPHASWRPGMLVRHGDLGPWNSIWQDDSLVGFIDWDLARPGYAEQDLAQLAWNAVPLSARPAETYGFTEEPDRGRRLAAFCAAAGAEPSDVIEATLELMAAERDEILTYGAAGHAPWTTFLSQGQAELIEASRAWLLEQRAALLS